MYIIAEATSKLYPEYGLDDLNRDYCRVHKNDLINQVGEKVNNVDEATIIVNAYADKHGHENGHVYVKKGHLEALSLK